MVMELPVSGVPSLSPDPSPKGEGKKKTGINPLRCASRKDKNRKNPLRCASRKDKNRKNPLRRMQNVSCEPWTL